MVEDFFSNAVGFSRSDNYYRRLFSNSTELFFNGAQNALSRRMRELQGLQGLNARRIFRVGGWVCAVVIVTLNLKLSLSTTLIIKTQSYISIYYNYYNYYKYIYYKRLY